MPPAENSELPKYNLPPPIHESDSEVGEDNVESKAASPETSSAVKSPKSSSLKTQISDFQLKNFSVSSPQSAVSTTTTNDNPTVADDNDLIEKEWVDKAKKIVEQNREDPKKQSDEMTLFKADYMKKRYNKVIKMSE